MLVGHQLSGVGQMAALIGKAKGDIIFRLEMQAGPFQISRFQKSETVILFDCISDQCVEGTVGSFEDQFVDNIVGRDDAFVADSDIRFHHTVCFVIIRCAAARGNLQCQQVFAVLLIGSKHKLRQRRDALFNQPTDCFGIAFYIGQPDDIFVVIYPKKQCATDSVGKGADAFQPAFWSFLFYGNFEITFCCLCDELLNHNSTTSTQVNSFYAGFYYILHRN